MNQTPSLEWPECYRSALLAVEDAQRDLAAKLSTLAEHKKLARIICAKCSAAHGIATQEYIQTFWYTPPHGCTGGDYWNAGEANWCCPSCGFTNRFDDKKDKYSTMENPFYRPEIVALKQYFGTQRECSCDYRRKCKDCISKEAPTHA